jgi:hypothetical protein
MSIKSKLLEVAIEASKLVKLKSLLTGDETVRTMIVSADIFAAVTPPFPDTIDGLRCAEFRGWLDGFLEGGEISVAEDPDQKPRSTMLARVHPKDEEFWSIRVTDPDDTPGIRSLGAFWNRDEFVALDWEYREDMSDFDMSVQDAIDHWRDIFDNLARHDGDSLNEYLSNYRAV